MKITKQIDERTFEVQLEDDDLCPSPYIGETKVTLAHDYIGFEDRSGIYTIDGLYINTSNISNGISFKTRFTLPIRGFQQVILPLLNDCPYLKDDHFDLSPEGRMRYDDSHEAIYYWDGKHEMVAFKLAGDKIFSRVTAQTYELIKKGLAK
jgi:hypothetical protein